MQIIGNLSFWYFVRYNEKLIRVRFCDRAVNILTSQNNNYTQKKLSYCLVVSEGLQRFENGFQSVLYISLVMMLFWSRMLGYDVLLFGYDVRSQQNIQNRNSSRVVMHVDMVEITHRMHYITFRCDISFRCHVCIV